MIQGTLDASGQTRDAESVWGFRASYPGTVIPFFPSSNPLPTHKTHRRFDGDADNTALNPA